MVPWASEKKRKKKKKVHEGLEVRDRPYISKRKLLVGTSPTLHRAENKGESSKISDCV